MAWSSLKILNLMLKNLMWLSVAFEIVSLVLHVTLILSFSVSCQL